MAWKRAGKHVKKIAIDIRTIERDGKTAVADTRAPCENDVWVRWARGEFNEPDGDNLLKQLAVAMETRVLWAAADVLRGDKAFHDQPSGTRPRQKENGRTEERGTTRIGCDFCEIAGRQREAVDEILDGGEYAESGRKGNEEFAAEDGCYELLNDNGGSDDLEGTNNDALRPLPPPSTRFAGRGRQWTRRSRRTERDARERQDGYDFLLQQIPDARRRATRLERLSSCSTICSARNTMRLRTAFL